MFIWNSDKLFSDKFREKVHPEKKVLDEIHLLSELHYTTHRDLGVKFIKLDEKFEKFNKKLDVLLDLKILKEKIDKLVNL